MSRKDFEQQIYLYEELSPAERVQLDQHLLQCDECNKLMEQVLRQRTINRKAFVAREMKNPSIITSNIMRAIQSGIKPSWPDRLATYLNEQWLRWTLTAISAALILFFIVEQQGGSGREGLKMNDHSGSVLNTRSFLEAHRKVRARTSIASWYDCLKNNDCDEFGKTLKLRKNYANI